MDIPDIDQLLNADEENTRSMRPFLAPVNSDLPRLLNEPAVLYDICGRVFGQEVAPHDRTTIPDVAGYGQVLPLNIIRGLLLSHIGTLYMMAVADILRMRVTAPLAYLRLQCESVALMKLMRQIPSIAGEWAAIQTDEQGRRFFSKYNKQVRTVLESYGLASTYDIASGSALHSRFIGLARRFSLSQREGTGRTVKTYGTLVQEFDPKHPEYFLTEVLSTLIAQAHIFANIQDIAPEITDPILLETRIPSFIQGVARFDAQFRQTISHVLREP
jgi:hypothetical protein